MSELRSRSFLGVLYPDSESYSCSSVLSIMQSEFEKFAYILHDCDVDENGESLKPHIHWIGQFNNQRFLDSVAKTFLISSDSVQLCKNFKFSLQYLLHYNNPEKFQYRKEQIITNFNLDKYFAPELDESEQAAAIAKYIIDSKCSSM